jgi:hypothetical protein
VSVNCCWRPSTMRLSPTQAMVSVDPCSACMPEEGGQSCSQHSVSVGV